MLPPFVSLSWLDAHRDDVTLAHVQREGATPSDGTRGVPVDLDRLLAAPPSPEHGRHPLPTPERFAEAMAQAGIGAEAVVVAHDDEGGVIAARLVWMLRALGCDAALLEAGLPAQRPAWPAPARPAAFAPRPWPSALLVDVDDVARTDDVVLDARPFERYRGAPDPLDPRPGHVPDARSAPCREDLDADGSLLPDDVLRRRYADEGVDGSTRVVAYCGSGVTACHTLLVVEHLGLGRGRLYPGSWSQWAADPDRPARLGDAP